MTKFPLISLVWLDAHSPSSTEVVNAGNLDEMHGTLRITTVGWELRHDDTGVTLASEFCGTSLSSLGLPQARLDGMRAFNPHVLHARSDQRGYGRITLGRQRLQVDLRVVDDARDPASGMSSQGRWVVEAGRPGPQRAG